MNTLLAICTGMLIASVVLLGAAYHIGKGLKAKGTGKKVETKPDSQWRGAAQPGGILDELTRQSQAMDRRLQELRKQVKSEAAAGRRIIVQYDDRFAGSC